MRDTWQVAIVNDTSKPSLGGHGLHGACHGLPGVDVVAHVAATTENLAERLSHTGARRHYPTLVAMLEHESPDLVVLCSRHPYDHLPQIQAAAEAGCHVYCEKPLAVTLPEADRIVELAEQHGILICMAHPARYAPEFRELKRLVEAGAIGTPLTVYGRGKSDHRGGGEDLVVLGTHILDYHTFLCGAPECLWADVTVDGRPISRGDLTQTVEPIGPAAGDSVFACYRFPGDIRGTFESRRGLAAQTPGVMHMGLTVRGTEGSLSLRFNDPGLPDAGLRLSRFRGSPEDESSYEPVPVTEDRVVPGAEPLDYSLCGQRGLPRARLFLDANRFAMWDLMCAIEEQRQPVSNVYTARLVVEMIQAIYASQLTGRVVRFPLTDRAHPLGEGA